MSTVHPDLFRYPRTAITATRLLNELGCLAGFMLNDETRTAGNDPILNRPPLPSEVGCCWPIIGVRDQEFLKFLLPAFLLPLQWRKTAEHDKRLPPSIHDVANAVLKAKGESLCGNYSIHFHDSDHSWPDLHLFDRLSLEASSAFASMFAGLSSLLQNVPPNPQVWASVIWDGEMKPVDLLEQKIEAATIWGVSVFYVSPAQSNIQQPSSPSLLIKRLRHQAQNKPERAFADYFVDSLLEPNSDEWETCRQYHAAVREFDRDKANDFYVRVFFRLIVDRLRRNIWISDRIENPLRITHLITIATRQTQPVQTLVSTLGIEQLLVLYTDGPSNLKLDALEIRDKCANLADDVNVVLGEFLYDPESIDFPRNFFEGLRDAVSAFTTGVQASRVAFDIDRGVTLHKAAIIQQIAEANNKLVSLYHEMSDNGIQHGTERLFVFNRDESWNREFRHAPYRPG